jgi:hypothetical protein
MSTPTPMPEKMSPIMLPRRRLNQCATRAPLGTQPTAHTPAAATIPVTR